MKAARSILVEGGKIELSSNILKQQARPQQGKKVTINTADFKTVKTTEAAPQLAALDAKLAHKTAAYQQKLKQMKEDVLTQAKQEADSLKQQAYQTGLEQGTKDGYQEALTKGQEEMNGLIKQAQANVEQSLTEGNDYTAQKQSEITSFAIKMAETILKTQLDLAPEKINSVLSPLFFDLEKPDEVLMVWANSQYHSALTDKLTQIKEEVPDFRYIIFDDDSLDELELRIESNESEIDLDIKQELQDFLAQL